ncbi:hypothetical protein [Rothia sp. P7208]|uniref:hypothetical protein n=1 Tax=Rothia sp. P7208 TaxID=3402660 RepID=UPI003AC66342
MTQISRRTLAKGAAWAAPVVAASAVVPAYATSPTPRVPGQEPYGTVCSLFFGGGNVNMQTTSVYLAVNSGDDTMKPGETVTWQVTAEAGSMPETNYSKDGRWSLEVNEVGGSTNGGCVFTVTLTANVEIPVSEVSCVVRLIWTGGGANVRPKTNITVNSSSAGGSYNLGFTTPRRFGTSVNDRRRTPVIINGGCYPTIQWSNFQNTPKSHNDQLEFNGQIINPNSDARNDQSVLTGTCPGSQGNAKGSAGTSSVG